MNEAGAKNIAKLVLGTAQFGLNYGISNQHGQLQLPEVKNILTEAERTGITTLDTATAYGNSELTINQAINETGSQFRIISKYPPNRPELTIREAFEATLKQLGVETLYGYLLHSYNSFSSNPKILDQLQDLKAAGKIQKAGISLYHPSEADELLHRNALIDIIQLPYSIFDRRFEHLLPELKSRGIETHVRSVYLQGLYFMEPDHLPEYLAPVADKIKKLHRLAADFNLPVGAVCLGFVFANNDISNVVIGVESLQTLQENISYCHMELPEELMAGLQSLKEDNEDIILPYKWPAQ
ncbi:aldo/keto reductase [Pontibacter pudoricolor]|uniref:aldo/keto reductase n=1 Tax=Pontibacter pudoricolor TaxID=2694930 RepID=UPI001391F562|nr:aldo/keto reductase [Pontibacter pudoricolor]